ncbi:Dynein light chain-related protein [Penicillium argentinense]|uniref:Dynein light chain-related protein n=1 Tax=Penicillium argentinense TaxID=1131581 RepID=A0A9W9G178_9EURO|nr:Dynein light chain-related protein [Penicillium argentinense]KAJ5110231.1 Dynein light chain-related protein [Penicillium argentinense]
MANPPQRAQQVPQHVTALLSHLTSRPGVESTLILSRKDGSIIQSAGLLAPSESGTSTPRTAAAPAAATSTESITQPADSSPSSPAQPSPSTYQPSQVEALAAHIFNYVSSASALGVSLSRPVQKSDGRKAGTLEGGYDVHANGTSTPREEGEAEAAEREEDDEVKLLRMRTRKHEIVVVPDRKYLLCVVHDMANASGGAATGGVRSR